MSGTARLKRVIVNADDFGFAESVTEGILRAFAEGIVTSTTITANMPAAEAAAKRLAGTEGLGVGVHLNVSQGPPLSDQGRLLAGTDGVMRSSGARIILRCIARPRVLDAIEAECDAQVRWALDHGLAPTHLDSHRHVHGWPAVFARVAAVARRYHVRFVRWHREELSGADWPAAPAAQRRVSRLLNFLSRRDAAIAGELRGTGGTWGVAHTGRIDAAWLIRAARSVLPGVTEIMTHPGLGGDLDAAATRLRESRPTELRALCDPAVREAFRRSGVELIHYGRL